MSELKSKTLKGILWSAIDKVGVKGTAFIVSIVIARILSPSDYGVIGMILVFIVIANIFIDSGMSQALVQRKNRSPSDMSTAFYFNITVSIICYLILYFCAPLIAKFYNVNELSSILRVLGLNIIVSAFATVQRANLIANLDFRTIAFVNVSAVLLSGIIGIWMACSGYGVWALVAQQMTSTATGTFIYWLCGKWQPTASFSFESFKSLWNFGSKLLATGFVATVMREIYSVAIGKIYRSSELGYYTRAVQTSELVAFTTNDVINAVTFPVLSSIQDNRDYMVSVYGKMLGMTAFFIFPIMTGLAVVATPFISVLLTDKWLPAVSLLQWLCFARMFTPISSLNMNILNAIGRSDLFMKIDFAKLPLTIITMVITIPLGVKAIVIGNFINTFICYFINAYLPGKMFNFGVKAQFRIFYKIAIATSIMALSVWVSMHCFDQMIVKLLIGIFTGIVSYSFASKLLHISEFMEIKNLAFSKINSFFFSKHQ